MRLEKLCGKLAVRGNSNGSAQPIRETTVTCPFSECIGVTKNKIGAVEKTRTSTGVSPQRPQRCASTSSATTARDFGLLAQSDQSARLVWAQGASRSMVQLPVVATTS